MTAALTGIWTIASIELRQRVRGSAWYVLLGVFVALTLIVTIGATLALSYAPEPGSALYSIVVYFVLLLATLVTPALSGNAINGDRDAGTLATTQVTLVSTTQIVLGKFLAAWLSSLAFLVAAVPFIAYSFVLSEVPPLTVATSLGVLVIELAVVSAVGVGLSGLLRRPLFSVVVTYLVVALLSVGTLIAFGIAGTAIQSPVTATNRGIDWAQYEGDEVEYDPQTGLPRGAECTLVSTYEYNAPRFDYVWWLLAANPYVVVADAAPTAYDANDYPVDVFGWIKAGVRGVQQAPDLTPLWDECDPESWNGQGPSTRDLIENSTPSWFVGLAIHVVLGGALLVGAVGATRTPARRLSPGSRIA
ncbi:ABC transporter permease [Pseudolysinimonas yzui]|uniref:ABC transporter permease n=1 Tax=Pseudolysinimonas yzui TaxID=2708254 RepID=A0A8J3M0W6_9MICO|nr:ABC transporter permease [Pseudolysinimonas yzui]GHF18759.1 ABC transporter permease [Pseudolysinimonas yzui]